MIVAWVMTRELDVGKVFAVSSARIPSMMEVTTRSFSFPFLIPRRFERYTLDRSPCPAGKAFRNVRVARENVFSESPFDRHRGGGC